MSNAVSPLEGKKVLVTRPDAQSSSLSEKLRASGAIAVHLPGIEIIPPKNYNEIDKAINCLAQYDWIVFTSINGVKYFTRRMHEIGHETLFPPSLKIAAIGSVTAEGLEDLNIRVDFIPSTFVAENIAEEIGDVAGKNILLPQADIARENLKVLLEQKGASVTEVIAYHTVVSNIALDEFNKKLEEGIDIITFTSSSTVRFFHERGEKLNFDADKVKIACIGPVTAQTAKELGYKVWVVAQPHTIDGLVESMLDKLKLEKVNR